MSDAVGRRYAKALFELAKENKSLDKVSKSLAELKETMEGSDSLREFMNSPLYSRDQQMDVVSSIAKKAKLDSLVGNTLGVMAQKGRLNKTDSMILAFDDMVAAENDEVVANVVSAKKLTAAQTKKLAAALKSKVGKDVTINADVDPEILGGLIVNIGSTMIDNSLKGKLSKLHNVMKEVG